MKGKKTNWQPITYIIIGLVAILLLLVFSGQFLVVETAISEADANALMDKYDSQGYLCSEDSGTTIKNTECTMDKWTTGVYAGKYQIWCDEWEWASCSSTDIPNEYIYCLVDDGGWGKCYPVLGTSCPTGDEYKTALSCMVAKESIITTTTKLVTTTTGIIPTSSTTTTTLKALDCAENPLDVSCYSCKSYQEVKDGECKTTFKSILLWIQNWFVGLF